MTARKALPREGRINSLRYVMRSRNKRSNKANFERELQIEGGSNIISLKILMVLFLLFLARAGSLVLTVRTSVEE
jgi:hypothetical protein